MALPVAYIIVNGVRVAAPHIIRNAARYAPAIVARARKAIQMANNSSSTGRGRGLGGTLGGILRDTAGTLAAGGLWELGSEALGAIVDNIGGGGETVASAPDLQLDEEGERLLSEMEDSWSTPAAPAEGVYEMSGGGAATYDLAHKVVTEKIVLHVQLTQEAKDWLQAQLSARGWTQQQVSDPHLLACCMVAQGMVPPPQEIMIKEYNRDWLVSSGFSPNTQLAASVKDRPWERTIKFGLQAALAVRLGLAFVDKYGYRNKRTTARPSPAYRKAYSKNASSSRTRSSSGTTKRKSRK